MDGREGDDRCEAESEALALAVAGSEVLGAGSEAESEVFGAAARRSLSSSDSTVGSDTVLPSSLTVRSPIVLYTVVIDACTAVRIDAG